MLVTLTTVGYGDLYPASYLGRAVVATAMCFAVVFTAMPITIVGNNFQKVSVDGADACPCVPMLPAGRPSASPTQAPWHPGVVSKPCSSPRPARRDRTRTRRNAPAATAPDPDAPRHQ